jgi:FtsZ-interacting cell division protein ZipA
MSIPKNKEIENKDSPEIQDDSKWLFISIAITFAILLFVGWWNWLKEKRKIKKLKSEFAAEYGISQKVLMRWIELFCSEEYNKNYAHKNAKKIPQHDLYQDLGKPEPGKKFGKQELAEACFTHRNTLNNHLKQISNFAEEIKISHKEYLSLRRLPPKAFHKIVELHKQHFHENPPTST